jgi:hypothetical protein
MEVRLDYGRTGLTVNLPDDVDVSVLEPQKGRRWPIRATQWPTRSRARRATKPLAELARGRRDAVVVISDKTRPIPYGLVLPPVLSAIEAGGVPRERIEILVATGLHRANTPDELAAMTSPDIVARYRIRNHVARDAAQHVHLGRTARGTSCGSTAATSTPTSRSSPA